MIRRLCTSNTILYQKVVHRGFRSCANCVYWKLGENTCSQFSEKDVIYGDEKNISARECRKDETKCGQEAKVYKELTTAESWQKLMGHLVFKIILPVSIVTTGTLMVCDYLFSSPPRRRSF